MRTRYLVWLAAIAAASSLFAADPPRPALNLSVSSNGVKTVTWGPLVPALQVLRMLSGEDLSAMAPDGSGVLSKNEAGYVWQTTNNFPRRFYGVEATHLSSNALFTYNLFNRIAYGPTPDEIERVLTGPNAIGPQAYLDEQLAFQNVAVNDPLDTFVSVTTNAVPPDAQVNTNWSRVTVTGRATSSLLYMYLTAAGDAYIDDISLVLGTNANVGPNLIRNGDFETAFPGPWTVSGNHGNSAISTSFAHSGSGSLRLVATTPGSTLESSIWQNLIPAVQTNQMYTLSFWYLPRTNSSIITLRLSGSGIAASPGNEPGPPSWVYVTQTGTASSRHLYMYLSGSGDAYIDDIKLVSGSVPEAGANLIRNGNFEAPLTPVDWHAATNATNSHISSTVARNGNGSLRMVFSSGGSTFSSAIVQSNINVTMGATYTLSYWYVPSRNRTLTVRLSGNGINTVPDSAPSAVYRRLATTTDGASLSDLRSWFVNHAVGSKGQLMEVLLQFLENHFVTQHAKTVDYLDRYYDDFNYMDRLAANMEFREIKRWREALLNPNCTFYDLLEIHAESPAEIIYLDTVDSRGDGNQIANENYARELFELFAMGVDNGYDQNDIVAMSRAWTGWSVDIVDHANEFNPFAPRSTTFMVSGSAARSNLFGIWAFNYRQANHGTNRAPILSLWSSNSPPGNPVAIGPKRVDARFGSPWAGTPYQLAIPRRTGTNGIQDGYDVIRHLADLPYTMEFISVKLCRLFVHDEFVHGVYDYTDPNRSAEAELIRQCMVAWNTPGPDGRKGNMRSILRTIFNSELFRSHGGSLQKVKTPLEFVTSAIRALRSANSDGTFTAGTGDSSFNTQLNRMGAMSLFNRADPDGYPETGPPWISAGTLAERLRFVQTLVMPGTRGDDAGSAVANPVALLQKKLPSTQWYDAGAVTDFFLGLLYPAEGLANLNQYRSAAITFLNTADNATTPDPLRAGMAAATYDTRIRGMVAMLMTFQRFQEQ